MSDTEQYTVTVTADNFQEAVLDKSRHVPVLVDFWAPWCAPCQTLMPILSKLAADYAGGFVLAKVNSDEQQALAQQYQVRGIPALKLFRHGDVVEQATGVQPESVLREMIDRHRERPVDKLRLQAQTLYSQGDIEAAIALLEQAYTEDTRYLPSITDLAIVLIQTAQYAKAEELLKSLPANLQVAAEIKLINAQLAFAKIAENAPTLENLQATVANNADDHQSRYQLSARYIMSGHYIEAMDNLLELMRRDRKFADDAGRHGLLAVFEILGSDPLVAQYRAKMSRLLY